MSRPPTDRYDPILAPRASIATLLATTALGSLLGLAVRGDRHMPGDTAILTAIQGADLPGLGALVTLSNLAFSTGGALVLAALFIVAALLLRVPALARQVVIVIVARLLWEVWKPIFASPRPGVEHQPDPSLVPETLGYPSGHAQTAAIIACMLVVLVRALGVPRHIRWATIALGVALTALALFSRIHIGAHWPSDTLGGVIFGLGAFALMQLVVARLQRHVPS